MPFLSQSAIALGKMFGRRNGSASKSIVAITGLDAYFNSSFSTAEAQAPQHRTSLSALPAYRLLLQLLFQNGSPSFAASHIVVRSASIRKPHMRTTRSYLVGKSLAVSGESYTLRATRESRDRKLPERIHEKSCRRREQLCFEIPEILF